MVIYKLKKLIMKKIYSTSLAIALLLTLTGVATAETGSTTKNRIPVINKEVRDAREDLRTNVIKPIKAEIEDLREGKIASSTKKEVRGEIKELKGEIKQKREEFKAEVKKKLETAAKARLNNNLDRMNEALTRIVDVNTRIESRINKIKAEGKNVATSSAALLIAKGKAAEAKTAIDAARTKIAEITDGTTTDINVLKEYVKGAEEALQEAKKSSAKAISTLKGFGRPEDKATTTPERD